MIHSNNIIHSTCLHTFELQTFPHKARQQFERFGSKFGCQLEIRCIRNTSLLQQYLNLPLLLIGYIELLFVFEEVVFEAFILLTYTGLFPTRSDNWRGVRYSFIWNESGAVYTVRLRIWYVQPILDLVWDVEEKPQTKRTIGEHPQDSSQTTRGREMKQLQHPYVRTFYLKWMNQQSTERILRRVVGYSDRREDR